MCCSLLCVLHMKQNNSGGEFVSRNINSLSVRPVSCNFRMVTSLQQNGMARTRVPFLLFCLYLSSFLSLFLHFFLSFFSVLPLYLSFPFLFIFPCCNYFVLHLFLFFFPSFSLIPFLIVSSYHYVFLLFFSCSIFPGARSSVVG